MMIIWMPADDRLLEGGHHAHTLELGHNHVRAGADGVVDLLDVVLDRVHRIADVLVVPADHRAEVALPGADRDVPVAGGLRNPDRFALRPEVPTGGLRQRGRGFSASRPARWRVRQTPDPWSLLAGSRVDHAGPQL